MNDKWLYMNDFRQRLELIGAGGEGGYGVSSLAYNERSR